MYKKEILEEALKAALNNKISVEKLFAIVMEKTNLINEASIKKVIKALEVLGYIKLCPDGFFELNQEKIKAIEP